MKRIEKSLIVLTLTLILIAFGCSKNQVDSKSMEQIYKEEGVPVKVQLVEKTEFSNDLQYNCNLTGIQETPVNSMLSDQVEKIFVKIGDYVRKDQVLMSFPTNNPTASYHQAEAGFEMALATYNRMKKLYEGGGISKQDLDGAETQYKVSKANWEAVQQAVRVKAPIDGIVTDVNVFANQKVQPGDLLCTVGQINKMRSRIWVTEKEVMFLKDGDPIMFRWDDHEFNGRITSIALSKNQDKQAFGVDIEVNNNKNILKSGINGDVIIATQKLQNTILVDRKLIQKDDKNQEYVYVVNGDKAELKYIERGLENNLKVQVKSGLQENDQIVIEGFNMLTNNAKVKIIKN